MVDAAFCHGVLYVFIGSRAVAERNKDARVVTFLQERFVDDFFRCQRDDADRIGIGTEPGKIRPYNMRVSLGAFIGRADKGSFQMGP